MGLRRRLRDQRRPLPNTPRLARALQSPPTPRQPQPPTTGQTTERPAWELQLAGSRRRTAAALGPFLLSPLPSAQLFVAAGLLTAPLRPLAAAFLAGRLVSYSIYVTAGRAVDENFGGVVESAFRSPLGIVLQVLALAALVLLLRFDWTSVIARRSRLHPPI